MHGELMRLLRLFVLGWLTVSMTVVDNRFPYCSEVVKPLSLSAP